MSSVILSGSGGLTQSIVATDLGSATIVIIDGYTSIDGAAFYNKPQITSVTIPNSVTSIEAYAFYACSELTSITIPNSVTSISSNAFAYSGLTTVTISAATAAVLGITVPATSITFFGKSGVTTVLSVTFSGSGELTQAIVNASLGSATIVIIEGYTSIGENAFQGKSQITSVTIPNSVASIGTQTFFDCDSLSSVTFEPTSQVTSIGIFAFYDCSILTSITIPNSVTSIGLNAFGLSGLTTVTISAANTLGIAVPATDITFYGKSGVNTVLPTDLISNICFLAGTPITTDQGNIPIEKIDTSIHTIRNKKIVAITKTVTQDKYLVCFEKDALGKNIPSQKTIISKNHKLFYNGKMRNAKEFLKDFDMVTKVKYTGSALYNVLLEEHDKMMVNNLICETLDPENGVAKVYMALQKLDTEEEQQSLIQKINAHVIKNDVFNNNKKISK
jgi:fructose-specific phosphotransferase system component IIB